MKEMCSGATVTALRRRAFNVEKTRRRKAVTVAPSRPSCSANL